jgi:hypothetical protein
LEALGRQVRAEGMAGARSGGGKYMRSSSLRRLAGAAAALMLATVTILSTTGVALASPPNWVMTVEKLPEVVSNSSPAGYRVTIVNNGPSNISSLFLVDNNDATPVYLTSSRPGTCNETPPLSGPLRCSFGALNNGQSVTVVVAYATPSSGGSFAITFQGNTTGDSFKDFKNRSHGDLLLADPAITVTGLTTSKNFAGRFGLDGSIVSNDQNVGNKNVQATSVQPPGAGLGTSVQDGTGAPQYDCTACGALSLIGEWSTISVNNGDVFPSLFRVDLLIYGQKIPKDATIDTLVHIWTSVASGVTTTHTDLITETCNIDPDTGKPTNSNECIVVTPVDGNTLISGWLFHNGGVRGG